MALAAEPEHRPRRADAVPDAADLGQAEDRAELLVGQRLLGDDQRERRQQHPGRARHPQAGLGGDPRRVLPDEPGVEMPAGKQQVTDLVPVLRREQVRARALQVPQQSPGGRLGDDQH